MLVFFSSTLPFFDQLQVVDRAARHFDRDIQLREGFADQPCHGTAKRKRGAANRGGREGDELLLGCSLGGGTGGVKAKWLAKRSPTAAAAVRTFRRVDITMVSPYDCRAILRPSAAPSCAGLSGRCANTNRKRGADALLSASLSFFAKGAGDGAA